MWFRSDISLCDAYSFLEEASVDLRRLPRTALRNRFDQDGFLAGADKSQHPMLCVHFVDSFGFCLAISTIRQCHTSLGMLTTVLSCIMCQPSVCI